MSDSGAAARSSRRVWMYRACALLLALLGGPCLAELATRIIGPQPLVQRVQGNGLRLIEGVPVWGDTTDREHRDCVAQHPGRTRVAFFGSSITFGSGISAAETFTTALEDRLNAQHPDPGFCVLNFAQSGFSFEQKLVTARQAMKRYRPELMLWEDWVEWFDYAMIGDSAYGVAGYRLRADGYIGIAGVPDALNRWLLGHSRLYEYLTLSRWGERTPRPTMAEEAQQFVERRLGQVPELAASVNAGLVMYLAPPLDRPFRELAATPPDWHLILEAFARARGIPVYALQRELIGQDYLKLRMDPCCHYNAAGHRALVPIMERIVLEHLPARRLP